MSEKDIRKRMAVGFLLICVCSVLMHMFLMHKKALRTQRYTPVYPGEQARDTAGVAQGMVSSASADRFHLQVGNRRLTFELGEGVRPPAIGALVEVRYEGDFALEIQPLKR